MIRLPRMGNLLTFIFSRESTSVTADAHTVLAKLAPLLDGEHEETCAAQRRAHVEERQRIEHAHTQILEVMAESGADGSSFALQDPSMFDCSSLVSRDVTRYLLPLPLTITYGTECLTLTVGVLPLGRTAVLFLRVLA